MQKLISLVVLLAVTANCAPAEETQCPNICPQLFSPTCATEDGSSFEQFDNTCMLKASNCQKKRNLFQVHGDFCKTKLVEDITTHLKNANFNNPQCKACDKSDDPVCVSNGKVRATASNKCTAEYLSCVSDDTFTVIKEDSC